MAQLNEGRPEQESKGGFNFSFLFERLMGRECVSEKKWGCGWSAGEGGNAWNEGNYYWKRNSKANNEAGGLGGSV